MVHLYSMVSEVSYGTINLMVHLYSMVSEVSYGTIGFYGE
jgi:hypothetical protein